MIDQKEANAYVNGIMKKLDSDPESLDRHEKRLALKYRDTQGRIQKISKDISDMRNQIEQAQARLRSLELALEQEQGRSNGFIEYLVDLKFVEDPKTPEPSDKKSDNGGSNPANRKERRALASRSKKPGVKAPPSSEAAAAT